MTDYEPNSALWCLQQYGWSFTPLIRRHRKKGKDGAVIVEGDYRPGKVPLLKKWEEQPKANELQIQNWLGRGFNLGLRTGSASGVIVIDLDTDKPEYDAQAAKALQLPPDTVTAITGKGGWHLYYKLPAGVTIGNSASKLGPAIDVRGDGGQIVFPGSVHPETNRPYTWRTGHAPDSIVLAELPAHIVALLTVAPERAPSTGYIPEELRGEFSPDMTGEPGEAHNAASLPAAGLSPAASASSSPGDSVPAALPATSTRRGTSAGDPTGRVAKFAASAIAGEVEKVRQAVKGTRNNTLNQCAFRLGQLVGGGLAEEATVTQALSDAVAAAGWDYDEEGRQQTMQTITSGIAAGKADPRHMPPPSQQPRQARGTDTLPAAPVAGHAGGSQSAVPGGDKKGPLPELGQRDSRGRVVLDEDKTLPTAQAYVREFHHHAEGRTLHCHGGRLLAWQGNRYVEVEEGTVRQRLQTWLHHSMQWLQNSLVGFNSNPKTVAAALKSIADYVHVPAEREMPAWLSGRATPDPLEILCGKSHNLHIPSGTVVPATPDLFTCSALDFDYDPDAPDPTEWLKFLHDLWGDDAAAIQLLKEWFGYAITADTRQQKMLLIVGPRRSGKGTIGRILADLVGRENVAGPTTASLAGSFGLQPLLGKSLAIVSDARFGGADIQPVVERLLCISGEDRITVDRKYHPSVTLKLPTRFVFLSNEIPRLRDAAGALAGRFLVLTLRKSFYGNEDVGLMSRLRQELPGILRWALEGWDDLYERGRFCVPESSREHEQMLEELSSPVQAFVNQKCRLGPEHAVTVDDLWAAWERWCEDEGRDKPGTRQGFGRELAAAIPGLTIRRNHAIGRRYEGLCLAEETLVGTSTGPQSPSA